MLMLVLVLVLANTCAIGSDLRKLEAWVADLDACSVVVGLSMTPGGRDLVEGKEGDGKEDVKDGDTDRAKLDLEEHNSRQQGSQWLLNVVTHTTS